MLRKSILKKVLIANTIIFALVFVFSFVNSFAAEIVPQNNFGTENQMVKEVAKVLLPATGLITAAIMGILKLTVVVLVTLISGVLGSALIGVGKLLTVDAILFNNVELLNLDFWGANQGEYSGYFEGIAKGFRVTFVIGLALQFVALIAALIKYMTINTSMNKADVKELLVNIVKGTVIMFGVLSFMFLMIQINTTLVKALEKGLNKGDSWFSGIDGTMFTQILTNWGVGGFVATLAFAMGTAYALVMFWYYLKRFVRITFLMMIAPLITATYTLDMVGDKKSQTVNIWVKDFMTNLFIQPFHILVYLSTVVPVLNSTDKNTLLSSTMFDHIEVIIVSIVALGFIHRGEKLVRRLFGVEKADSLNDSLAVAFMVVSNSEKIIKGAQKVNNEAKEFKQVKMAQDKIASDKEKVKGFSNSKGGNGQAQGQGKKNKNNDGGVSKAQANLNATISGVASTSPGTLSAPDKLRQMKARNKQQKRKLKMHKKQGRKRKFKMVAAKTLSAATFGTVGLMGAMAVRDLTSAGEFIFATSGFKEGAKLVERVDTKRKNKKEGKLRKRLTETDEEFEGRVQEETDNYALVAATQLDVLDKLQNENTEPEENSQNLTDTELQDREFADTLHAEKQIEEIINKEENKDKDGKSDLQKEYETNKKAFIKHLTDTTKADTETAAEFVSQVEQQMLEGRTVLTEGLSEEARAFMVSVQERLILQTMELYKEKVSEVPSDILEQREEEKLGKVSHISERIGRSRTELIDAGVLRNVYHTEEQAKQEKGVNKEEEILSLDKIATDLLIK